MSKTKKTILIVGVIIILVLLILSFFLLGGQEKRKTAKPDLSNQTSLSNQTGEEKQEFYFLTKEEKEEAGIDSNLEIKARKIESDLGLITVIEFPKSNIPDQDQDGLSDEEEQKLGTDLNKRDSDGDGIDDKDEIRNKINPLNPDSDGNGISDGEEMKSKK